MSAPSGPFPPRWQPRRAAASHVINRSIWDKRPLGHGEPEHSALAHQNAGTATLRTLSRALHMAYERRNAVQGPAGT
jgi:hypothetical protein